MRYAVVLVLLLGGCASTPMEPMSTELKPCPASPNCVCSDAAGALHAIEPLRVAADFDAAWEALLEYLRAESSYTIVMQQPGYIRAEARTRWLRFVDDVEFSARPDDGVIAMRSASRLGFSDLGANRHRLEKLRGALTGQGVVTGR